MMFLLSASISTRYDTSSKSHSFTSIGSTFSSASLRARPTNQQLSVVLKYRQKGGERRGGEKERRRRRVHVCAR
jgi:hypothetical protein